MRTYIALILLALSSTAAAQCELGKVWHTAGLHPDFGRGVAIDGDTLMVGYGLNSGGLLSGSVDVYAYDGSLWVAQQKLTPADIDAGDKVGWAIALDGDVALLGSPGSDEVASFAGAGYIYRKVAGTWIEEDKLLAPDGASSDSVGQAVALLGDVAVVASEVVGTDDAGGAYVFRFDGADWNFEQRLIPSDGAAGDGFGRSVSISGDTILVGAPFHGANDSGAAYVFRFDGAVWNEEEKLVAGGLTDDETFGYAVSLDGDRAVITAPAALPFINLPGKAHVFDRSGVLWSEGPTIVASDGANRDRFGAAAWLEGDTLLIGAPFNQIGGNSNQGAAYLYRAAGGVWSEDDLFTASDGDQGDQFGHSVHLNGERLVVGAPWVDGIFSNVGAAYPFDLSCDIDFYGCDTTVDGSLLIQSGLPRLGETMTIGLDNIWAAQTAGATFPFLAIADAPDPNFPCGTRLPGWSLNGSPAGGELLIALTPPNPLTILTGTVWQGFAQPAWVQLSIPNQTSLAGSSFYVQGVLFDPVGTIVRFGLTDAFRVLIGD